MGVDELFAWTDGQPVGLRPSRLLFRGDRLR